MEQQLLILESKLEQLLALVVQLRGENAGLEERLQLADAEKAALLSKLETAKHWVEQLIAKIPDESVADEVPEADEDLI